MKKHENFKEFIKKIILLFFVSIALLLSHPQETQAADNLPIPESFVAKKESETSIRLKWDKCKDVDGYYIYRYDKKKGKYKKVKEVIGAKKRTWVDKKVKTGKVYQYKVASFRKKRRSKKSYAVSAIAYGKDALLVNAGSIDFYTTAGRELNICAENKITAYVDGDISVKYYDPTPLSEKVVWSSSDPEMASVDSEGNVRTHEKEGVCEIIARAHNGVTGKVKLTVTNYARPKSFPYYDGRHSDINLMLTEYKENVFNIATYFTVKGKEGVYGTISMDESGNVTGYPDLEGIESIYGDVENILVNYPMVVKIHYGKGRATFLIDYGGGYGALTTLAYSAEDDMSGYPGGRIAPHWSVTVFVPAG